MGTSVLHIKTEVECRVYLFDEEKGIAKPGTYFNLEVRKGEQDLLFVSTEDETLRYQLQYKVEDSDTDYQLTIENAFLKGFNTELSEEEIAYGVKDEYGVIYSIDGTQLLKSENTELTEYWVKEGCIMIMDKAFCQNSLMRIILPNSLSYIGNRAFENCQQLTNISLPDGLTYIGDGSFAMCESLTNINFPKSVKYIGKESFVGCDSITMIHLPEGLTHILFGTFCYCYSLEDVKLPKSLKYIENNAFEGCESLTNIQLPIGLTHIGDGAFSQCENLAIVYFPEGLKHIGDNAFEGCKSISSINLSEGLVHIGNNAFHNCESLTYITLPKGLKHLGECAFYECKNLLTVHISDGMIYIGDNVFAECINLTNIDLPESITHIGNGAFLLCESLKSIHLPKRLKKVENGCFYECRSLVSIHVPDGLMSIGDSAFYNCFVLSSINLNDGLMNIEDRAFYGCEKLATINMPTSLMNIGDSAFSFCSSLSHIYIPNGKRAHFERLLPKELLNKLAEISSGEINYVSANLPYYIFFDTETTGVPRDYNAPASNTRNWPRLVQLGWIVTDEEGNVLSQGNEIVKPEGFVIPADAARVHGITTERAQREGKPLREVIEAFLKDAEQTKCIVGHNISFDQKVVGAELYRLGIPDTISTAKSLCTMQAGTDYCKIPGYYGYKWPKLQELYHKLFGCDFEDAHDAMADITATMKCFFEMRKRGLI